MEKSRTKNSMINVSFGLISQILITILKFISQTFFIKILGAEYLGLNGLFTNVLTILSFAELGIGNAIIFSLYKEIAQENVDKIKSLMDFYKRVYIKIGTLVFGIGLCLLPFIKYIINGEPNINENLYVIYIFFLSNTAISYFFSYKKSIIQAYQKGFIVDLCRVIVDVLKTVFQVLFLIITQNYLLFLVIQITCTIIDNLFASFIANKLFPYLKDNEINELPQKEIDSIFLNVKSLVLYKFGSVILNGTDNIIISKILGLSYVGITSNYMLLINTINTVISSALNGFTASIGNLNVDDDTNKQKSIFNQLFLLSVWIYGFCGIAFFCLVNKFVLIWLGEEYILDLLVVFAITLHFFITGVQFAGYSYRTTLGLFKKGKYCPISAAIINIILSIVLGKKYGLAGIILATSIARLITTSWYDIYIVFKTKFNLNPINFYFKYLKYFFVVLVIGIISNYCLSLVSFNGIWSFIIQCIVCTIVVNLLFLLFFGFTEEYKNIYGKVKNIIIKNKKKV